MLVRINAPHYCAGLVVERGWVTEAAPILHWALGLRWERVERYFKSKGFQVEKMR